MAHGRWQLAEASFTAGFFIDLNFMSSPLIGSQTLCVASQNEKYLKKYDDA
jgi:hypothetical protein